MTVLQFLISCPSFERFLLHSFKSLLNLLRFLEIYYTDVSSFPLLVQLLHTVSTKSSWSVQKFSNLKMFALGILVLMEILQGM
jgi:hypothetical protein